MIVKDCVVSRSMEVVVTTMLPLELMLNAMEGVPDENSMVSISAPSWSLSVAAMEGVCRGEHTQSVGGAGRLPRHTHH